MKGYRARTALRSDARTPSPHPSSRDSIPYTRLSVLTHGIPEYIATGLWSCSCSWHSPGLRGVAIISAFISPSSASRSSCARIPDQDTSEAGSLWASNSSEISGPSSSSLSGAQPFHLRACPWFWVTEACWAIRPCLLQVAEHRIGAGLQWSGSVPTTASPMRGGHALVQEASSQRSPDERVRMVAPTPHRGISRSGQRRLPQFASLIRRRAGTVPG